MVDEIPIRIALLLEQYGGRVQVSDGGLGSNYGFNAEVRKTVLGLVYYPLNLNFFKKLDFNLGVQGNVLIAENVDGKKSYSDMSGASSVVVLGKETPC
jgi:hypothetical protein